MTSPRLRICAIAVVPALIFSLGACSSNSSSSPSASASATTPNPSPSPTTVSGVTVSGPLDKAPVIAVDTKLKPPTELVINDIVVGNGAEAQTASTVETQYSGVLYATGKAFNSSWADNGAKPISFPLDGVIPGWQQGIPGMKVGGRRLLIIPPSLAYRAQGSPTQPGQPQAVPPGATLVFVIDLLGVQTSPPGP